MFSPMEPVYLCTRATLDTDRGPVHLGLLGPEDTSQMVLETSVCDAADPLNSQLINFVAQELLLAMNIARASSPFDDGTRLTDASVFAQVISILLRYLHANLPSQAWTPSVLAAVLFLRRTAGYLALPPDHEWDAPLLLFSAALMLADKVTNDEVPELAAWAAVTGLSRGSLREWERLVLRVLDHDCSVRPDEYAALCAQIRPLVVLPDDYACGWDEDMLEDPFCGGKWSDVDLTRDGVPQSPSPAGSTASLPSLWSGSSDEDDFLEDGEPTNTFKPVFAGHKLGPSAYSDGTLNPAWLPAVDLYAVPADSCAPSSYEFGFGYMDTAPLLPPGLPVPPFLRAALSLIDDEADML